MREQRFGYNIAILAIAVGFLLMGGPLFEVNDHFENGEVCELDVTSNEQKENECAERSSLYMEGELSGIVAFYGGDKEEEFNIRITEDYNGEEYTGDETGPDQWNNDNIYDATVSIGSKQFRDKNGNEISGSGNNPFVGFASGYGSPYNGPDEDGFSFSNNQNWFATDGFDDFKINLQSTVIPGDYTLYVIVHYKIRVDYDDENFEYIFATRNENVYIPVEVKSGLAVPDEKEVTVYDTPSGDLYAGAKLQKIGVTGLSTRVGDVGGIGGTLSYTGSEITIPATYKTASLTELNGGATATLFWRIDVKENAAPGFYYIKLSLAYTRNWDDGDGTNDIKVTENSISLKMAIAFTPLISPPNSQDLEVQLRDIDQEIEGQVSFDVTLTNGGNVDLSQITVSLDLTAAKYFYTSEFYYDEDDNALKVFPGTEKDIASLELGKQTTVKFTVGVRDTIPPGKFIIPILYEAKYFDTGVFGGSSIDVDTDEDEYHDILTARGAKEPDDKPYIFVLVEDSILDLEATTNSRLQPGMVEANLAVNIQNVDGYDLSKLNITIINGSNLPIFSPDGDELEFFLVDTLISGWTTRLDFLVNVKEGAAIGVYDIPVQVTCLNELEETLTVTVICPLEIIPVPPDIVVAMVETPVIEEGSSFTLEITVMNIGGSAATDVTLQLFDETNMFESGGEDLFVSEPFDLGPSDNHMVKYKLKAHKVEKETVYNLSVRAQYKDTKGNLVRYSQTEPLSIQLRTEKKAPASTPMRDWFLLILGLLFLATVVLLPTIYFFSRYNVTKKMEKKEKKKLKKSEKKEKKREKEEESAEQKPPITPTPQPRAPRQAQPQPQWGGQSQKPLAAPPPLGAQNAPQGQVPRAPKMAYGPPFDQRLLPEHR